MNEKELLYEIGELEDKVSHLQVDLDEAERRAHSCEEELMAAYSTLDELGKELAKYLSCGIQIR